jgi:predicted dehydrogenase
MTTGFDRRAVLSGAAAAGALGLAGAASAAAPDRPYRVGVVGAGWFGKLDLHALMAVAPVEVVALCDVDSSMLREAREKAFHRTDTVTRQRRRPAIYHDFRDMLARHQVDIVIVATPDHWHTLPAIAAMNKGAHVYLEKPISVDVIEGRAMLAAARANNVVVQNGTQRRTSSFLLEARDRVVKSGLIGKIGAIEVFCYYHQRPAMFPPNTNPPPNLDWDFYCGPAPLVAYNPAMHPRDWRAFEAFGNGYMGDVGVHFVDAARWLAGLAWPKRISSTGGVFVDKQSIATVPDTQSATFEYDDLLMTWTNRQWGRADDPQQGWGAYLHGENGTLRIYNQAYEYLPNEGPRLAAQLADETAQYPQDLEMLDWERPLIALTRTHMRDFITAIQTNGRPAADIEDGYISTSTCILANLSMKLGRPFTWDGEHIVGDDEANAHLARPYRAPWVHP